MILGWLQLSYTSDYVVYIFRLNDSRMVTALGESYTSL